jgi:hypothetical protein
MFELAQARVQAFMEARTFCLPEAFAIFAKVRLIPGNGASTDLIEQRADEEESGSHSTDGGSDVEEEEAVDLMVLLKTRLKLRPSHLSCIAGGFSNTLRCAIVEAESIGNIVIRKSSIENGGNGVFATKLIKKGEELLPYWGELLSRVKRMWERWSVI